MAVRKQKIPNELLVGSKSVQDDEEETSVEVPSILTSLLNHSPDQQVLDRRGIILIDQEISKETISAAMRRLLILHFNDSFTDPIQVILNSLGGTCDAGWAFIDLMGWVKNTVRTVGIGEIASMAASIFVAGDERILAPNCSVMIHQFYDSGEGYYKDLIAKNKAWELEMSKDIAHLMRCSKYKTPSQIKKYILHDFDHWMSPEEMVKHGLCDGVFKPKPRGKKGRSDGK